MRRLMAIAVGAVLFAALSLAAEPCDKQLLKPFKPGVRALCSPKASGLVRYIGGLDFSLDLSKVKQPETAGVSGGSHVVRALQGFFKTHAVILSGLPGSSLALKKAEKVNGKTIYHFHQVVQGLTVHKSVITFKVGADGRLLSVRSGLKPVQLPAGSLEGHLTPAQLDSAMLKRFPKLSKESFSPVGNVIVFSKKAAAPVVAMKFLLKAGPLMRTRVFIDANTGEFLFSEQAVIID